MNVPSSNINITSGHPERLAAFYRDIVGLTPNGQMGDGAFDEVGAAFLIDGYSDTKSDTK
jgi:hypothetical protein